MTKHTTTPQTKTAPKWRTWFKLPKIPQTIAWSDYGLRLILPLFVLAIALSVALSAFLAYQFGMRRGLQVSAQMAVDDTGNPITVQDIRKLQKQNTLLQDEVQILTQERDISLHTLQLVRGEIQTLKNNNADLQILTENLSHIISQPKLPKTDVVRMKLQSLGYDTYEYQFDIFVPGQQKHSVEVQLALLNETSVVEIPIKPSTYTTHGLIKIRGRFVMPTDDEHKLFIPNRLQIALIVNGERTTKSYDWKNQA